MNVLIETFGCQMNKLDSEVLAASLHRAGHALVDQCEQADVILYNTCAVRDHAEQKVLSRIGIDGQRKSAGLRVIVGVLGCMAQRMGTQLPHKYPQVDFVAGPGQLPRVAELIDQAAAGRSAVALDPPRTAPPDPDARAAMDAVDLARDPDRTDAHHQAFVRVARGCDNFCTYCIVPFVRGPEQSRSPHDIVAETRRLVEAGRSEITLLGQTVNRYRWTQGDRTVRFAELLDRVADVPGLRRLRFVTSHPLDFTADILHRMASREEICEYIHCPAQSGSDRMLRAMNRKYTRSQYDRLVDLSRKIVPGVVWAGDFIVGFPGESDDDHQASVDLIGQTGYKNVFVFKYSARPGTPAARTLPDDVAEDVKKARNNELLAVQAQAGLAHHRQYVGQAVEVLVEGPSKRADCPENAQPGDRVQLMGRTRGEHIVVFAGPPDLAGQYRNVRVTDANALTLFGRLDEPSPSQEDGPTG